MEGSGSIEVPTYDIHGKKGSQMAQDGIFATIAQVQTSRCLKFDTENPDLQNKIK